MGVSIQEFIKAVTSLEEAIRLFQKANPESDEQKAFRDACLQRFEYCVELAWRVSIKVLGGTTAAAKPAIREMAQNKLISDPQVWFDFVEARNETSHSYDEDVAKKIFETARKLPAEARKLIQKLGDL